MDVLLAGVIHVIILCPDEYSVEFPRTMDYFLVKKGDEFVTDPEKYKKLLSTARKLIYDAKAFDAAVLNDLYRLSRTLEREKRNLVVFGATHEVDLSDLLYELNETLNAYDLFMDKYFSEYYRYINFRSEPHCDYTLDENIFPLFDRAYYFLIKYYRDSGKKVDELEEAGLPREIAEYVRAPYKIDDVDELSEYIKSLKPLSTEDISLYWVVFQATKKEITKRRYYDLKHSPVSFLGKNFPDVASAIEYAKLSGFEEFERDFKELEDLESAGKYESAIVSLKKLISKLKNAKYTEDYEGGGDVNYFFILVVIILIGGLIYLRRRINEEDGGSASAE